MFTGLVEMLGTVERVEEEGGRASPDAGLARADGAPDFGGECGG